MIEVVPGVSFCSRCILPTSRPNISLSSTGVCNACEAFENSLSIEYSARISSLLSELSKRHPFQQHCAYDCVVPVSGGKDSTFQVKTLQSLGVKLLCISVTPDQPTPLGRANLDNLRQLGSDMLEFTPNTHVRREMARKAFFETGHLLWAENVLIYVACNNLTRLYGVSHIVWGEDPSYEDGWAAAPSGVLNSPWKDGLYGYSVTELRSVFPSAATTPYTLASKTDCVVEHFLSYYVKWDPFGNPAIAATVGFRPDFSSGVGNLDRAESLDNYLCGPSAYGAYLRTGTDRNTSLLAAMVRRNIITRERAAETDSELPRGCHAGYLGKPLEQILSDIGISIAEYVQTCDRFTNKALFRTSKSGKIIKSSAGTPMRKW